MDIAQCCSATGATGKLNAIHRCINGRQSIMTQLIKPEDFDVSDYRTRNAKVQVFVHKIDKTSGELVDSWSVFKDAMADARSVALTVPIDESPSALLTRKGPVRVESKGAYAFSNIMKKLIANSTVGQNDGIDDGSVLIGNTTDTVVSQ